ncbi:ABC transporter permease [Flexivirga endophytica]|uniref:ABC transporter permease n=1 Tax=Flexivirga endophytica TaxID=1849103 RepID=A0A916T0Y1_9MICO|nr:ABC transporter permease [Flexivirga endophytica]GGB23682.1 ABC transporter permease [Flexivirga endophytica]GHB57610.1 ABC transporter permease [Flexivirga endophytica]
MTTTEAPRATSPVARRKPKRKWTYYILPVYTWAVLLFLCLPIFVMILFGFNDTKGRYNITFQGFTLKWYKELFAIDGLTNALINSLTIAVIATVVSVAVGGALGMALGRYRFRGKGPLSLVVFAQIATPELVLGTSLLSLFLSLNIPRGYTTILLAHIMFCIPFVAVTVQARVAGLDGSLKEAAMDLGATPVVAFRKITLPMIMPGLLAGALLSFALSIDDFVTTSFNAGQTVTFPLWVYGASRLGIPAQVNVMGTLIFLFGLILAGYSILAGRRKKD